jgi:type I restriction enzyme S subunit
MRRWGRYPAYKHSGVTWLGEIPTHWDCSALSRVSTSRCDGPFGSGLKSEHYVSSGVRVVRLQNIGWARFVAEDQAFIDETYADQLGDHSVAGGDLLIAGLGDENHPVGRACVAPPDLGSAMVKADCFRFRLRAEELSPHFAAYQLSATADAAACDVTGATRSRMNLTATAARKVTRPPLGEQLRITGFLDRETAKIDALVAKKERLIELLQEKRAALITSTITKGLDPNVPMKDSGVEWLRQIPAHWTCLSVSRVTLSRCDGPFGCGLKSEHYVPVGVRVIRLQNIGWTEFVDADRAYIDQDYAQELGDHNVVAGDLLIAGLGDEGHPVGRACVAPDDIKPAIVKADCFRFRLDRRLVVPRFAAYQLSVTAMAAAGSLATGATRARMNLTVTATRKIALPPPDEQQPIVDALDKERDRHLALFAKVRDAIVRLKELRTALVSTAVTGKIDVRESPEA